MLIWESVNMSKISSMLSGPTQVASVLDRPNLRYRLHNTTHRLSVSRNTKSYRMPNTALGVTSVTKHSIQGCEAPLTNKVQMWFECFDAPKVVAAGFPPDLGFRNTRFLQCVLGAFRSHSPVAIDVRGIFQLSKFTLHSDLRRRAASCRALPRTSSYY